MAWRPPSPDLGPQAQGHIEQRRTGFSPTVGKQNGETCPPGPLLTPLCLLSPPKTLPLPVGLAALLTWPHLYRWMWLQSGERKD